MRRPPPSIRPRTRTGSRAAVLLVVLSTLGVGGATGTADASAPVSVGSRPATSRTAAPAAFRSGCLRTLHACGYPDATNTGARVTDFVRVPEDVTRGRGWHYDGDDIVITRRGTVLQGISTRASIEVTAARVTVRDNLLQPTGEQWGVGLRGARRVRIAHNTIRGGSGDDRLLVGIKSVSGNNKGLRVIANDISATSTGIQLDNGVVKGNYVHDLGHKDGDHLNGFTSNQGEGRLVLSGNTFLNDRDQTDAISLFQDFGHRANVLIDGNMVAGGGYTIYAGANAVDSYGVPTNIVITNNRFARAFYSRSGFWGPLTAFARRGKGNVWSGNVWDDTGRKVRPRLTLKHR